MKTYFDKVSDDKDTMIVTRKSENIVVMSQSTYDSLMETLHLTGNKHNYDHLMKSVRQFENGNVHEHDTLEDEA